MKNKELIAHLQQYGPEIEVFVHGVSEDDFDHIGMSPDIRLKYEGLYRTYINQIGDASGRWHDEWAEEEPLPRAVDGQQSTTISLDDDRLTLEGVIP